MIGKQILHYKILEEIGRGGMGVVYKAEDTKLERTVCLKFTSSAAIAGEEEKKRFKREAKAAGALNHSNICHIYAISHCEEGSDEAIHLFGCSIKQISRLRSQQQTPYSLDYKKY